MSLTTRLKLWAGTLVLIAAVGLAYSAWDHSGGDPFQSRFDETELVLHVSFNKYTSHPAITVQLSSTPPMPYASGDSGTWERVIKVPPRTRVILSASQETRGYTELAIVQNGRPVPGSPDGFMGPGTLSVQHIVE